MPPKATPKRSRDALKLDYLHRWEDLVEQRTRITWSVGSSGELVVLSLAGEPDYWRIDEEGGSYPKPRAARPNRFRVHTARPRGRVEALDLEPTTENIHLVQPIDDGRWLLVRGRTTGPDDENALLFDATGKRTGGFATGDAVQDVQLVSTKRVWLAYFDENAELALECRELSGEPLVGVAELEEDEPLVECMALNAGPELTLAYMFPGFPVIELDGAELEPAVAVEHAPVEGARAIAWSSESLVYASSFEQTDSLFVTRRGEPERPRRVPLVDPRGEPFEILEATGRGPMLWLADGVGVARLDTRTLG